jgi:hypothetical protein
MALAWIMWRDLDQVRFLWDEARANCASWSHIGAVLPDEDKCDGRIEPKFALEPWGKASTERPGAADTAVRAFVFPMPKGSTCPRYAKTLHSQQPACCAGRAVTRS